LPFRGRAIGFAASHSDAEYLQRLLKDGRHGAGDVLPDGGTPVIAASGNNARTCLSLLLEAKADPHQVRTTDGATPIYVAAYGNSSACLKLLLEVQVDPTKVRTKDGAGPIHAAAERNSTSCLQLLLDARADPCCSRAKDGTTPIHIASQNNAVECMSILLTSKADPNCLMKEGSGQAGATPLHLAVTYGHLRCLEVLIGAKAEPDIPRLSDGATPVFIAVQLEADFKQGKNLLRALLDAWADPSCALTTDGTTPTILAVEKDSPQGLKLLIDAQADLNIPRTSDGATSACSAAMKNRLECLRIIHNAKADLNIPTKQGWAPLDLAEYHSFREMADLLRSVGAKPRQEWAVEKALREAAAAERGIKVTIVSARGLRIADIKGKADPYVVCEVCCRKGSHDKFQTKVIRHTTEPMWNHEVTLNEFTEGDSLKFDIWDKDIFPKPDDFLGTARLLSHQIYPGGFQGEIPLQQAKTNKALETSLKLCVKVLGQAAGPPASLCVVPPAEVRRNVNGRR